MVRDLPSHRRPAAPDLMERRRRTPNSSRAKPPDSSDGEHTS
jgi:hypothetical protein